MKLTDKAQKFLAPCNNTRIRFIGIVDKYCINRVSHNCYNDKHNEYSIIIRDVKAEVNDEVEYIKKYIKLSYNPDTSKFSCFSEGDSIEFYARIDIVNDELYLSRPTKTIKITTI